MDILAYNRQAWDRQDHFMPHKVICASGTQGPPAVIRRRVLDGIRGGTWP